MTSQYYKQTVLKLLKRNICILEISIFVFKKLFIFKQAINNLKSIKLTDKT